MNNTKLVRYIIIIVLSLISFTYSQRTWRRIGLEGVEVTSLYQSLHPMHKGMLIGTKKQEVYIYENFEIKKILPAGDIDTAIIYCFAANKKSVVPGVSLYAGTDKGLYAYVELSGPPPHWVLIDSIPKTAIMALCLTDSVLFASDGMNIYRTPDPQNIIATWDTVLTQSFFNPERAFPSFRCFATDPGSDNNIYAGSIFLGPLDSWSGIVHSSNFGDKWEIWNDGWPGAVPSINTMAFFKRKFGATITRMVGTPKGVYCKDSLWNISGLEEINIHNLYVKYSDRSLVAIVYAATDSGIYVLYTEAGLNNWIKAGSGLTNLGVNVLCAELHVDHDSVYAGTTDGLYLFTYHGGSNIENQNTSSNIYQIGLYVKPNPINAGVIFSIELKKSMNIVLDIHSASGKLIRNLIPENSYMQKGLHTVYWDGRIKNGELISKGIYFYKLHTDNKIITTKKLIVVN
jgi:hypothetical protein